MTPTHSRGGNIPSTWDDGQRIEQLAWLLFFKIMYEKDQEQELLSDD